VGLDLHWLPHAHGALEVARLAKEIYPHAPVIMGGLSSTYFHRELIGYPQVDFVLRGDSTEAPLHQLLTTLREGGSVAGIANLTWKDSQGAVRVNPHAYIPNTLDYVNVRPELLVEMVLRYRDLGGVLPFNGWWRNPVTMVLPLKGCAYECVTCGSSHTTCTHLTRRTRPVFRSPESLVANVRNISRISRGPIIIPGDLLQGGEHYARAVLEGLRAAEIANELVFELFDLPPAGYLGEIDRCLPNWSFEISPESHDHAVRIAQEGEPGYDNAAFEAFLQDALTGHCHRIDVFFMIGLPRQTHQSVLDTVEYCGRLFELGDRRLNCFISPMGPFVDPGSRIFEQPERFGYRLFARTLEEHRQLLVQPSWEQILNYETRWMSRAQLVDATYDAAERLNLLKLRYGRISRHQARTVSDRIAEARRLRELLRQQGDVLESPAAQELRGEINRFSVSTVCDKSELTWPRHAVNFHPLGILCGALAGRRALGARTRARAAADGGASAGSVPAKQS
jgi:B12-binding domain/radical SAM domain protein